MNSGFAQTSGPLFFSSRLHRTVTLGYFLKRKFDYAAPINSMLAGKSRIGSAFSF